MVVLLQAKYAMKKIGLGHDMEAGGDLQRGVRGIG